VSAAGADSDFTHALELQGRSAHFRAKSHLTSFLKNFA